MSSYLDKTGLTYLWNKIKSAFVTALGTSGNYLTWTKNGTTNNITVPYATNAETNFQRIISEGENLVINGSGYLGDNTNFSPLVFDGSQANKSTGSFKSPTGGRVNMTSAFPIKVDPNCRYKISLDAKSDNNSATTYAGVAYYDCDDNIIYSQFVSLLNSTLTTLAQDLNDGDTVVHLTSVSSDWVTSSSYMRGFIFWDYVNSYGYKYPVGYYSRHAYETMYESSGVDINNNTITLKSSWNKGKVVAGTPVSRPNSGRSYNYCVLANVTIPTTWTSYTGSFNVLNATSHIRLVVLDRYNSAEDTIYYTNFTCSAVANLSDLDSLVPNTRKVNGKALSSDITLSASDVNALPSSTVIPAAQIQSDWNQTNTSAKDYIKNKPTIPTVNNATLTIQKEGTSVGTFTANASSAKTINIVETDPVFSASAAAGISSTDISEWDGKQEALVSGTNIKTVNNQSLLGSGNITIEGGSADAVTYTEQTLTDAQKTQARTNIGAEAALTFDSTPTASSSNPVTSGGVYTAIIDAAYLGSDSGTASSADFDPQADTVWNIEQTLGSSQKAQARANIGAQETLVSGTNIKTINNTSLLGSGDITISGGGGTIDSALSSSSTNAVQNAIITTALNGKVGSSTITTIVSISQSDYDALSTKDSATLYVITS